MSYANPEQQREYNRTYRLRPAARARRTARSTDPTWRAHRAELKTMSLYGLTREQYHEMLKRGCYACGSKERLSVDHDHSCCPGRRACEKCVRGVLCHHCNTALGLLGESVDRIGALRDYLVARKAA